MIPAVIERCAGIDVGKKILAVCVMVGAADAEPRIEKRMFGTFNVELEQLRQWLEREHCTHVVMESTGSYWKPVHAVLERSLEVILANGEDVKGRKGHKTDFKDAQWLAHLLRHGMVRASFIPPQGIRELRDLTRRRKQLLKAATAERNRVQKVLEEANVKLGSVLSDVFGVSGQLMLEALLEGKASVEQIANLAQRRARSKIPDLLRSLEGHRMSDHQRGLIQMSVDHLAFLEKHLQQLDDLILKHIQQHGYQRQFELLQSVPGLAPDSAASILAEVGPDMQQFPSAGHLSSFAGVSPGNNRSAGKSKGSRTVRGNKWLRSALVQCAWAASAKNDCFLKDKFWRLAAGKGKEGKKKALVAVAHIVLVLIYRTISSGQAYQERGTIELSEAKRERLIRHHVRRLGRLGVAVYSSRPEPSPATKAKPKSAPRTRKKSPMPVQCPTKNLTVEDSI
jgi:transposase